jgi:hypothetical protein
MHAVIIVPIAVDEIILSLFSVVMNSNDTYGIKVSAAHPMPTKPHYLN